MAQDTSTPETLHYACTASATKRHYQNPADKAKTLCGGFVRLADEYFSESEGKMVSVPLETLFMETRGPRPVCARCAASANRHGFALPNVA